MQSFAYALECRGVCVPHRTPRKIECATTKINGGWMLAVPFCPATSTGSELGTVVLKMAHLGYARPHGLEGSFEHLQQMGLIGLADRAACVTSVFFSNASLQLCDSVGSEFALEFTPLTTFYRRRFLR
jgi:hypothetical protein